MDRHLSSRSAAGGFILLIGGLMLAGCSSCHSSSKAEGRIANSESVIRDSPFAIRHSSFGLDREDVRVVDLVFDVVRIDLPIDDVQHSRKVWNHIDELRVDMGLAARLARNGLRVGAASPDAWPAIGAIADAADADVRRERLVAQRGLPLTIELASIGEAESIFSYGRNGRLVGNTFPTGHKLLNVDYVFHPHLGGWTELRLSFEVRHDRGVMTWEKREGVIRQTPALDRHVFADLSVLLTLHPNEFLVIGLSDRAQSKYLIGSCFLSFLRSDKRYETLLCVTPQPFQTKGVNRLSTSD